MFSHDHQNEIFLLLAGLPVLWITNFSLKRITAIKNSEVILVRSLSLNILLQPVSKINSNTALSHCTYCGFYTLYCYLKKLFTHIFHLYHKRHSFKYSVVRDESLHLTGFTSNYFRYSFFEAIKPTTNSKWWMKRVKWNKPFLTAEAIFSPQGLYLF